MEVDSLENHPFVNSSLNLVPLPDNDYVPAEDDIDPALRASSEVPEPVEEKEPAAVVQESRTGLENGSALQDSEQLVESHDDPAHTQEDGDAVIGEDERERAGVEDDQTVHPHQDAALTEILAHLRAAGQVVDAEGAEPPHSEEQDEETEEVQQRELSTPLSSVPDLPTELSLPAEPAVELPPMSAPISPSRPPFFIDIRKTATSNGTGISPNAEAGPSKLPTHPPVDSKLPGVDTIDDTTRPKSPSPKAPRSPLVDRTPAKRKRTEGQTLNYALEALSDEELEAKPKAKVKRKTKSKKRDNGDSEDSDFRGGPKRRRGVGEEGKAYRAGRSRKMLDHVLGMDHDSGEHPEKIAPRARTYTDTQLRQMLAGKQTETQISVCLRPRYEKWGKCTQCIAKLGGDACRFRNFRTFKIDPETAEILGPGYFESTEYNDDVTPLPKAFNSPMTAEHVARIERTAAPLLLPMISRELRHVIKNKGIKRGIDAALHRAVCDFCASTIFAGWWFCKRCGRDICLVCERYFSDSLETMSRSPWALPDAARPRLLKCSNAIGSNKPQFHFRPDLQPVSRFSEEELKGHWLALAEFVLEGGEGGVGERLEMLGLTKAGEEAVEAVQEWTTLQPASVRSAPPAALSDDEVQALYTKSTNLSVEHPPDPAGLEQQSKAFIKIDDDTLANPVFDLLWGRGEPIVVDKVGEKLKMSWTPEYFVEHFGREEAWVVDCQTSDRVVMTIEAFFTIFKDRENRPPDILKLKDWPTAEDFADAVPELYTDFCDALPVPDYTRREGVLNLYANFPPGPTRPDIGPKMYNAFEAREDEDGKGSTSLHMDVADAINVMLYASARADGQPGCAVWDLFRAEDADKIRALLQTKFDESHIFTDPIHSQLFYLNAELRRELWEKHKVASWRIYQYPGQAVFIPAGCAHQVCNLADCIKIAVDFVSPQNVGRCQQLTQDFRTENFVKSWKEDVLQLYNVLWYAWINTREIKAQWVSDAQAEARLKEERTRHLAALANGEHPDDQDAHPGVQRSHSGFVGHQISSARDEGLGAANSRDDEADSNGAHAGRSDGPSSETPTSASAAPKLVNGDGTTIEPPIHASDLPDHASGIPSTTPPADTSDPILARRRAIAHRLMSATLSHAEPPPPPEARNPSAATRNWHLKSGSKAAKPAGKIAKPSKQKPKSASKKKVEPTSSGESPGVAAAAATSPDVKISLRDPDGANGIHPEGHVDDLADGDTVIDARISAEDHARAVNGDIVIE